MTWLKNTLLKSVASTLTFCNIYFYNKFNLVHINDIYTWRNRIKIHYEIRFKEKYFFYLVYIEEKDKYPVKERKSPLEGRVGVYEEVDGCTKTIVSLEEFRHSASGALQGE